MYQFLQGMLSLSFVHRVWPFELRVASWWLPGSFTVAWLTSKVCFMWATSSRRWMARRWAMTPKCSRRCWRRRAAAWCWRSYPATRSHTRRDRSVHFKEERIVECILCVLFCLKVYSGNSVVYPPVCHLEWWVKKNFLDDTSWLNNTVKMCIFFVFASFILEIMCSFVAYRSAGALCNVKKTVINVFVLWQLISANLLWAGGGRSNQRCDPV